MRHVSSCVGTGELRAHLTREVRDTSSNAQAFSDAVFGVPGETPTTPGKSVGVPSLRCSEDRHTWNLLFLLQGQGRGGPGRRGSCSTYRAWEETRTSALSLQPHSTRVPALLSPGLCIMHRTEPSSPGHLSLAALTKLLGVLRVDSEAFKYWGGTHRGVTSAPNTHQATEIAVSPLAQNSTSHVTQVFTAALLASILVMFCKFCLVHNAK